MKTENNQYAIYGLFVMSIVLIFLPWTTTTIFYSNSGILAGFGIPKLTESGISTSIGVIGLFVCFVGLWLTYSKNKFASIAGVVNVLISIIHIANISKVNGRIEDALGVSAKVGYGVILFLLINIVTALLGSNYYVKELKLCNNS